MSEYSNGDLNRIRNVLASSHLSRSSGPPESVERLAALPVSDLKLIFRRPLTRTLGYTLAWTAVDRNDATDLLPVAEAASLLHDYHSGQNDEATGWVLFLITEGYGLPDQLKALDMLSSLATSDEELRHYGDMLGSSIDMLGGSDDLRRLRSENPLVNKAMTLADSSV